MCMYAKLIEHNLVGQPEIRKANFGGDHTQYWIAVSLKLRTLSFIWPMTISRVAFGPNAHCGKMYLDESFTQPFHKIIKLYNFINWPCFFNFCNYHFLFVIKHK